MEVSVLWSGTSITSRPRAPDALSEDTIGVGDTEIALIAANGTVTTTRVGKFGFFGEAL